MCACAAPFVHAPSVGTWLRLESYLNAYAAWRKSIIHLEPVHFPVSFEEAYWLWFETLPYLPKGAWQAVNTVGQGNHGKCKIFCAALTSQGAFPQRFALKMMPRAWVLTGNAGAESGKNELLAAVVLGELNVCGIAQVLFVAQDEDNFYLATELGSQGDVFSRANQLGRFNPQRNRQVAGEVLKTVKNLHAAGIAHRDLSLENFVLNETGEVRMIDFGQAMCVNAPGINERLVAFTSWRDRPGKGPYLPPELNALMPYAAKKVDMYAVGVMLFGLFIGRYPRDFYGHGDWALMNCDRRANRINLRWPAEMPSFEGYKDFKDLLEQLLAPNAAARPPAAAALEHPYLATVRRP